MKYLVTYTYKVFGILAILIGLAELSAATSWLLGVPHPLTIGLVTICMGIICIKISSLRTNWVSHIALFLYVLMGLVIVITKNNDFALLVWGTFASGAVLLLSLLKVKGAARLL